MTGLPVHEKVWVAAAPLWKQAVGAPPLLRRPAILGYGHDGFMEELLATLAREPERIADRLATGPSRSWRERRPGEPYDARPAVASGRLKLWQPVHGWFYLVAGSLVCQAPGLPDHPVDPAAGESAGFVVRRLDGAGELALVVDAAGRKAWRPVAGDALADGEEVLPLHPLAFQEGDRRRRVLAGLIPAGSQDQLLAAPVGDAAAPAEGAPPPPAQALEAVKARVTSAIASLQAGPAAQAPDGQQRELSRFALMDLADFLLFHVPPALDAVKGGTGAPPKAAALAKLLRERTVDPAVDAKSFADLVQTILATPLDTPFDHNLRNAAAGVAAELEVALEAALEEASPGALAAPVVAQRPGATLFAARLVYRRLRCGPLKKDVVSPRSEEFLLAPYFDPEAPSRPIRVALPFDASIRGLREFRKNVRMVLSESLRQKTSTDKLGDKLDGPSLDCGAVELSIPIITIVAMILLFVMISLLNLIFWWIPFVKICLPKLEVEP